MQLNSQVRNKRMLVYIDKAPVRISEKHVSVVTQ